MRWGLATVAGLGAIGIAGLGGCRGPAEETTSDAAGGRAEEPPAAPTFRPLGDASIPETIAPEAYLVVGWGFAAGGDLGGELPLEAPVTDASPSVRDGLRGILTGLEEARSPGPTDGAAPLAAPRDDPPRSGWKRTYRLSVARRWILDLELREVPRELSRVRVVARVDDRDLDCTVEAPDLLRYLRGLAFEATVAAMTRPRIPSAWHAAALASFLSLPATAVDPPVPRAPSERARLREEILTVLDRSSEAPALARALVPRVLIFEPEELVRFARATPLPLRLLALTRGAAAGERAPLDEILALSLEYFGEELLFASALEVIFPRDLNVELYALYPEEGSSPTVSLAFIQEIRARVAKATFRPGEGWVL